MAPPAKKLEETPGSDAKSKTKTPTATEAEAAVDVRRCLFPSSSAYALPEEESQKANAAYVKENGLEGVIALTGKGRTVEVVRAEMRCAKLALEAVSKLEFGDSAGLLVQPDKNQAAHNTWAATYLGGLDDAERRATLPLTGDGRTAAVVGADIKLAIAGAKHALANPSLTFAALPEEESKKANAAYATEHVPDGLIPLSGKGRTVGVVRRELGCFRLGALALRGLDPPVDASLFVQPEATQAAHNAWVSAHLKDDAERRATLPLTGAGRTAAVVGADIALVIAAAKGALAKGV